MQRVAIIILIALGASVSLAFIWAIVESISRQTWERIGRKCYYVAGIAGFITLGLLIAFALGWKGPTGVLFATFAVCIVSGFVGFHAKPI
jgi:hypothetical protein